MDATLLDLTDGEIAVIRSVRDLEVRDGVSTRLRELGFVPGESVQIVAHAPFGRDPIAVRVGYTRFALRRREASRVLIERTSGASA